MIESISRLPARQLENRPIMARQRSWNHTRSLVTGASSGLGKALAERLVHAGAQVILTGRSAERLAAVAQGLIRAGAEPARVITFPADLTIESDRQGLFDLARERFGALDLVINNAGVGATGQFDTHDPSVLRNIFEINFFAVAEVCRLALPLLAEGNDPVMVAMGSVNARRGLPGRSEYSASKFAVTGFIESIRIEWRRFGIHVLQVNPGFTDTPFDDNAADQHGPGLRASSADDVSRRRRPGDPPRHREAQVRDHPQPGREAPRPGQPDRTAVRRLGPDPVAPQAFPRRAGAPESEAAG